jgi:hypothetical protein
VTPSKSASGVCRLCRYPPIAISILGAAASVAWAQDFRSSLVLGPYSLSFGDVVVGKASDPQTITLLSTGTAGAQIDEIAITGPFRQTNNCPVSPASLAKDETCGIEVTFRPTAAGSASGTVSVFHDRSADPLKVSLTGIGTLNPSSVKFSPPSLKFDEQNIGTTSEPQSVKLESVGEKTLLISSIGVEGDFTIMPRSTCESLVGSLASNDSCTVVVTFTPLGPGKREGAIVIEDDAPDSPQRVPLTGMGRAP